MKVLVIGRRSVFKAQSHNADQVGLFGNSTDITRPTRDNSSLSAVCLEYRCGKQPENTYIVVKPTSAGCRFYESASGSQPYQNRPCGSRKLQPLQGEEHSICDDRPFYHGTFDGLYKPQHRYFGVAQGSCLSGGRYLFSGRMFSSGYALFCDCRY